MYGDIAVVVFTIAAGFLGFMMGMQVRQIEYVYFTDDDDGTGGVHIPDFVPEDWNPSGAMAGVK